MSPLITSYRLALRMPHSNPVLARHTDTQAWVAASRVPAEDQLRLRRLQYLPRLMSVAPPLLRCLLDLLAPLPSSWASLVQQDLQWAR